jgi:hypothetical protein
MESRWWGIVCCVTILAMPRHSAPPPTIKRTPYEPRQLGAWQAGRYGMLQRSPASQFIKQILCKKARSSQGKRFFGEAYVASTIRHDHGWYGSFKWLTSTRYIDGRNLTGFADEFALALRGYFAGLDRLQEKTRRLAKLLGFTPVAPDLWLIIDGKHHFIEVKLPHDSVSQRQLAGMALIAKYLPTDRPLALWIAQLYPAGSPEPEPLHLSERFQELYRRA